MQLDGKVALITGASAGIGRATATLFAREGARVVLGARRRNLLDALAQEVEAAGGEAAVLAGDVREEGYAEALVQEALAQFGGLDVAFNNAGILGALGPIAEMPAENWHATLATNLNSAFYGAKYQLPALKQRGGGSIIFTSSFVGYTAGMPGTGAYAASKAALIGLAKTLAVEHGEDAIRVNALLPGGTETDMAQTMADTPSARAFVEGLHALKRIAAPDEVARSALYLASDASTFTTGTAMIVDGGVSVSRT